MISIIAIKSNTRHKSDPWLCFTDPCQIMGLEHSWITTVKPETLFAWLKPVHCGNQLFILKIQQTDKDVILQNHL